MATESKSTGMRVLFASGIEKNAGPETVNRELVAHWPACDEVRLSHSESKVKKTLLTMAKGLSADVIVAAGADWAELVACRLLSLCGKRTVCFVHGYVPYENVVNKLGCSELKLKLYKGNLSRARAVVANSQYQMEFTGQQQPDLMGKLHFISNAVAPFKQRVKPLREDSGSYSIIVSGGTRLIKANEVVAEAVEIVSAQGTNCSMQVFGRIYDGNERMAAAVSRNTCTLRGQVPHEEFLAELNRADVFVMNSRHEPFGLSALDAIQAGCSVLLSRNCGVLGVLTTREEDVVQDCEDAEEVARKIAWLIEHPNSRRLYESIDFGVLNWGTQTAKLRAICADVVRQGAAE